MPDAVVILGAGASAEFGVPVLRRMFKDQEAKWYLQQNERLLNSLQEIFWEPRGHDLESSDQSLTIEEMLTALKDWDREDAPGPAARHSFDSFRKGLYVLIYYAVFHNKSSNKRLLNPLIRFCRRNFDHTTWASFNWDCIFEASFYYSSGGPPDLGGHRYNPHVEVDLEGWRQGPPDQLFLKLHGSVNWWVIDDTFRYLSFARGGPLASTWRGYDEMDDPDDFPVILEPSFYKYEPETEEEEFLLDRLMPQWDAFLERLLEADYIIAVGYSLPPADSLARSKLLTTRQVNQDAQWLVIDQNPATCDRYRRLVGGEQFGALTKRLSEFSANLDSLIEDNFPSLEVDPVGT